MKNTPKKTVWTFTNKRELTKSQFLDYFERKIFRTIRKYEMLPKDKITKLKKTNLLNTAVLKHVLEKKFKVKFDSKPNIFPQNLSETSEQIFENVLKGKFKDETLNPKNKPLYFLSDDEIELYAKLNTIKGNKRKQNQKVQQLFQRFKKKNPDLERNVVNAGGQLDN